MNCFAFYNGLYPSSFVLSFLPFLLLFLKTVKPSRQMRRGMHGQNIYVNKCLGEERAEHNPADEGEQDRVDQLGRDRA